MSQQPPSSFARGSVAVDALEPEAARSRSGHRQERKSRRFTRNKKTDAKKDVAVTVEPVTAPVPEEQAEFLPWEAQGWKLRQRSGWAQRGFYAPADTGAPSTTRQAEVLNTAVIAAPTDEEGIAIGEDVLSRSTVAFDPFTGYKKKLIGSPNVLVIGDVSSGKSALIKSAYLLRPLILKDRRAVVFDKKDQAGRGEYCQLLERYGVAPISFSLDGHGTVLNVLDPSIARVDGSGGQFRLLRTIAELAGDEGQMDEWEAEALRAALRRTKREEELGSRTAVLTDVVSALGRVVEDDKYTDLSPVALERLHQAGVGVRFLLNGLLEEYSGLFDGETSRGVSLNDRLTSFDISQLPSDGPASSMVVAIANMWLMGELRTNRGMFTYQINEEGWDLVGGANGRLMRSNVKLARGLGLSIVMAIHKIADIPVDSPAAAFLQEAKTLHIFSQAREEDQRRCVQSFNLEAGAASTIGALRTGHHLFKVGKNPEVHVKHIRSQFEVDLTNTDEAMTHGGRS